MKAYGIPRYSDVEWPDVADIQRFGMKSSAGKLVGDQHSYARSAKKRQAVRRYFKHIERQNTKKIIRGEIV
jgi:hypothetical protein